jgi:hypothetical protein
MRSGNAVPSAKRIQLFAAMLTTIVLASCGGSGPGAGSMGSTSLQGGQLHQLSTDTFSNSESQHATEVGPSLATFQSTLVTAFQVGRMMTAGATDVGFATSTNGGSSWTNGLLNGITQFQGGTYSAVDDPTVAYDQAQGVWIIASLGIGSSSNTVLVSRSEDAMNWMAPLTVSHTADAEKPWITCDNNSNSPYFGHCYIEWDDPSAGGLVYLSTSTDGGDTWLPAIKTAGNLTGFGGQPVVAADGLVVVPIMSTDGTHMLAFTSDSGGATWTASYTISTITAHTVAGNMRTAPLPSATADHSGLVYVVWQDCRFHAGCTANDIILTTSSDGITWTAPVAIPISQISQTAVDHFLPALAVDPSTSGSSASLGLTYYFFPNAACTATTCQLEVGFISSSDGGSTWGSPTTLAGPMTLSWLAQTTTGATVGDYVGSAYANHQPYNVFAVAQPKTALFSEAIYTTSSPLP